MIASIEPVSVFPGQATQLGLSDFYVIPNTTLNCQWQLLDSGNNVLTVGRTNLTSGQYVGWGGDADDDVYLPECYAANLGLTLVE